jgi:hypothetical protein
MKNILWAVLMVMAMTVSQAQAFPCTGKPSVELSLQSGTVTVNIGYGHWYLCSLNEIKGNITPRACEKIYNSLILAEALNNQAIIYFPNEAGSCQSIGDWAEPSAYEYYIDFLAGPAN